MNEKKSIIKKESVIIRHIKFFLIPGWRDKEFFSREYEIEKVKSKRRLFRRLLTPLTTLGFCLILLVTFLAVYAPWLTKYTIRMVTEAPLSGGTPWAPPDTNHILGTSWFGFDVYGRLIWGARTVLFFGFTAILIAATGGVILGTITGYIGGRVDAIIMRLVDFVIIFPTSLVVILVIQMSEDQSILNMLIIFGMFAIPGSSRLMRALVLQVKQELYIEAAITGGAKKFKVMFKHVLPNAISPIIISFFGGVGGAILGFSGIAYLGFGDQTLPDWGTDISNGAPMMISAIHATIWPGLLILIAVLGFMLVGDGLRDVLDPRIKL